jgi:hypothetical protein
VTELQPDVDDVLQEENGPQLAVPVCVVDQKTPLRTQALPRKGGATFTKTVTTTPVQVLWPDHRRARARIVSTAALLLAYDIAGAQDASTMAVWPANQPFEAGATTDVWVAAASGTAQVGIITELWAEGE